MLQLCIDAIDRHEPTNNTALVGKRFCVVGYSWNFDSVSGSIKLENVQILQRKYVILAIILRHFLGRTLKESDFNMIIFNNTSILWLYQIERVLWSDAHS